jgi:hypothetical protein
LSPTAPDGFVCHSFAADDVNECKDFVRRKLGLPPFQQNGHRSRASVSQALDAAIAGQYQRGRIVAEYDYKDEGGELLFQVVRLEPKSFRHRRPDGKGGWLWQGSDRRVVYRWPDLLKYPNATAFIVEGEKDADRLASLNLCATTVASGEWTENCVKALAGRDCLVLEDNDDTGRKKALNAATLLHPGAKSIRIVRLPGLPDGGDVSDWLDGDPGRASRFVDVCFDGPLWKPEETTDAAGVGPDKAAAAFERGAQRSKEPDKKEQHFKLTRFDAVLLGSSAVYLVKGLAPTGGLTVVWGPPKSGKSFWTFDLAMHVARGELYRGRRVQPGPVVYLALEGGEGFRARIEAYRRHHRVAEVPFYLITDRTDLVKDHGDLVCAIREQTRPVLVVIDTLNRSLAGSESKDEDMAAYILAADAIREAFRCAVIIIHHCGVDGSRPRGHTSLTGAADAQIAVARDAAANIVATVEWMKDGLEGDVIVSRLEQAELGADQDGEPITSCVVVPVDAAMAPQPAAKKKRGPKAAQTALKALIEAVDDLGAVPAPSNHIPPAVKVVTIDCWREYAYRRGISTSTEPRARQKAFKAATEHLIGEGYVGVWDEHVWVVH